MELPELFDHAHRLTFGLLRDGTLEGLRIDHVDGLLDPKAYLMQLREQAPSPFYLIVEKILARHEALRDDWPVEGTTGYEFTNLVLGLLVDPSGDEGFTQAYAAFIGHRRDFAEIVHDCKIRIMLNEMASELNVLARDAGRIARQNPGPPISRAISSNGVLKRSLPASRYTVPMSTAQSQPQQIGGISTGRWRKHGGLRRISIPPFSTFCTSC
jgi:(1->4)-alpha-D-glucan 1-alpha-D-glucosylmutase